MPEKTQNLKTKAHNSKKLKTKNKKENNEIGRK